MSHYFIDDDSLAKNIQEKKVYINDQAFVFKTDNGVFSKKGLDFGTRSLLENININDFKGNILDLGCGYGPIGIYLAASTKCDVDMVDINSKSVNLSKQNALLNKVNVNVFESDAYNNVLKKYDVIISNPPIRVGKEKLYEMLIDAKKYLKPSGRLYIVVNKDQGAKSLIKDMSKYYEVGDIVKNKGFYVVFFINN